MSVSSPDDGDSGYVRVATGAGFVWATSSTDSWAIDPTTDTVAGEADSVGSMELFFP